MRIPEYPPILTGDPKQDSINLREYIIRNIEFMQQQLLQSGGSIYVEDGQVYVDINGETMTLQQFIENNINVDGDTINITVNATIETKADLQEKNVNVTENGDFSVLPDAGKDGLSKVNLHVTVPADGPSGAISITVNGTVDVTDYASAVVNVQPDLQSKSATYTTNGSRTITPDAGKDGLSSVTVNVNVPTEEPVLQSKSVSPASSQQTVTPDSGYDGLSQVTVAGAPLQTRTVTPTAAGLQVEKSSSSYYGLQRVNVDGDANLISGNIRSGISIFGVNGSYSPSFQLQSKNATPSGSEQTITADTGYDGLSQVKIAAISMQAKSVTPSASQQEITPASGYNGLSKVTVAGDADLIASNIKKDVNIFGVIGTYNPSFQLQSKSVTITTNGSQTITPDVDKDGLSSVAVTVNVPAVTPNLQTKNATPSASAQTITPDAGYDGLASVIMAGDADLIAGNIKKDIVIFGVTGNYEPANIPINGSLIEITCSSNIDEVTATVNGNTYTARLNTSTQIAYVTIPYTDTIAAQTCVLKGYNSGSQVTSASVSMAVGIGYYSASLSTSAFLYDFGTYNGVSDTSWTVVGPGRGTVTNGTNSIHIECNNGNYSHTFKLNSLVDTRGYQNFEITYVIVSGSISGGGSDWAPGNSNVRFANQQGMRTFINFPSSSGEVSIQTRASTNGQYAMSDAELQFTFSCPMGGVPFVIDIYSIKFV